MYFPREEYEDRWRRVYDEMASRGLETCVVWQRSGGGYDRAGAVHWLSNYAAAASGQEAAGPGWYVGRAFSALVFHAGREPELHIIEPADTVPPGEVAAGAVVDHDRSLPDGVGRRVRELAGGVPVGYVGYDFLPVQLQEAVEAAAPGVEWRPHDDLLFPVQNVKSPRELQAYRDAGEVSSAALTVMMEALIAGESESEAAARCGAEILRVGGGFHRIGVHHGRASEASMWSDPFYGFGTRHPEAGDLVRAFVYGPIVAGYWIDPGRTAICGNSPTRAQRELVEAGIELTEGIMSHIRPGVTARQLGHIGDELLAAVSDEEEPKGAIWPIYGHGLGYFFMPPHIMSPAGSPDQSLEDTPFLRLDAPFEPGMVCTVETFVTRDGVGTTGFEEVFIITDDGIDVITDTPMRFW